MSQMNLSFEGFKQEIMLSINTLAPAKIIKYDSNKKIADIQPLFLTADKSDNLYKQSPIYDVPVLDHCTGIDMFENYTCGDPNCTCDSVLQQYAQWRKLKAGDLVFYIPAQRSLANLNGVEFIDPDSFKFMSSNDAVIVGRFST